jgi:hypothetical protein
VISMAAWRVGYQRVPVRRLDSKCDESRCEEKKDEKGHGPRIGGHGGI